MEKLLRLPDVLARTGLSRSAVYAQIAAGDFPKPVKITHRNAAWPESEVAGWINERIARREAA